MKIVHIITSMNKGGAETTLYKLLKYSKDTNSEDMHYIISFSELNYFENKIKNLNYEFIKINFKNKIFFFIYFLKLINILKIINPDVVQCWMYHSSLLGGIASKYLGVKKIIWNIRHSNYIFNKTKFLTILVVKVCAFLSKIIPNEIVYCSLKSYDFHKSIGYKSEFKKIIYNGYDSNYYKKITKKNNEKYQIIKFGYIGRYSPQKNINMYLEAISLLVHKYSSNLNLKLIMYGRDINEKNVELVKKIKQYKLTSFVELNDYIDDVRIAYKNIDFLGLSSSYGESFPNILAEAMLCGIPCISTDVGESKNILFQYGKIVKINDSNGFSIAIDEYYKLYKNQVSYEILSKLSREHIKNNYSIEKMFRKYQNLWINKNE